MHSVYLWSHRGRNWTSFRDIDQTDFGKLFKVNATFEEYKASAKYQQVHFSVIQMHLSALTFIKISILFFYRRLFRVVKWFTKVVDATIAFVIVWWLTFFIVREVSGWSENVLSVLGHLFHCAAVE